ncbi:MAG: type 1 glutamine amidotransferase [Gemmataceae bacterium]|nr:type 1 glutamine amidotransferase [Planctomycetia bacterium]MBX3400506.1 type 1 glutamine amidotransferase [Gemmataceae bacterium]
MTGKTIAVLVEQKYEELELWYPVLRFREAGATVRLVGPEAGKVYPSKLGYPAKADVAASDVSAAQFDAIIIPGGWCPDYLRRSPAILKLVRDAHALGKVLAAICHGPWVLCSTNALRGGRKATGFHAIKDDMVNAGATWVDAEVVVDGPIVTSRTPEDLPAFVKAIQSLLTP